MRPDPSGRRRAGLSAVAMLLASAVVGSVARAEPAGPTDAEWAALEKTGRSRAELEFAGRLVDGTGLPTQKSTAAAIAGRWAAQGDVAAERFLARLSFRGDGVARSRTKAAELLERAAASGDAAAEAALAAAYLNGTLDPNPPEANRLARAAAEQGDLLGMTLLGGQQLRGDGMPRDPAAGVAWLERAAAQRYAPAMELLGAYHAGGLGGPVDRVIAYVWLNGAAEAARSIAGQRDVAQRTTKQRDDLTALMTHLELAEAKDLSAGWQPGTPVIRAPRTDDLQAGTALDAKTRAAAKQAATLDVGTGRDPVDAWRKAKPAAAGPVAPPPPPVVETVSRVDVSVGADGSRRTVWHQELQIRDEAAIHENANFAIPYREHTQRLEIVEAYTLKPDGRKLPVDAEAIYPQLVPGASTLPAFDDQMQKVVVFPNVEVGDTRVLETVMTEEPLIPGMFSMAWAFDPTREQRDVRLTISAPAGLPLVTETHDMKFAQRQDGERTVYEWTYANPQPRPETEIAVDALDRFPRLFASSMPDYDRFAAAYAALSEPKLSATPRLQKLAGEITAGVQDRRRQAELIYDWVGRHIRYVALELGRGAIIPRDPDAVLASGYGDCKDHSTLFAALLRVKGIDSQMVLINLGRNYAMPAPPTFSVLNHAINYIPEFDLYVDTTAAVAPFGVLPFFEYGKPVVFASAAGNALRRVPQLSVEAAEITTRTSARLGADGVLSGDTEVTGSGPFALDLRQMAAQIQAVGGSKAAKQELQRRGLGGTGTYNFASPFTPGATFRIAGHFDADRRLDYLAGNSFPLPHALSLGWRPGDGLMGPLNFMELQGAEPTPCFGGREVEELSLELPPGRRLRGLPRDADIRTAELHYTTHWSQNGRVVTVRREFVATPKEALCTGAVRVAAARAINDIRGDYNQEIALVVN